MPEQLPPFPDVAAAAARATVPPPFTEILGRARRRRRRAVLTAAAATAVAVAAAATATVLAVGDRDGAPQPVRPTPSPSATTAPTATPTPGRPDPLEVVRTGVLTLHAAGTDGSLLTLWQACGSREDQGTCTSAWQLRTAAGTVLGRAPGEVTGVYAAGEFFVVNAYDKGAIVVDASGGVRPVARVASGTVAAGVVFVHSRRGLLAVDPRSATAWPLGAAPDGGSWIQAAAADDGTTWALSLRGQDLPIVWHRPSGTTTWQRHVLASTDTHDSLPAYLAVAGRHVAALSGYDGATVLPVADLAITTDAGRTWADLHQVDLPFQHVDAIAATSGGTLFVTTPEGGLFRTTDDTWTRFAKVPNPHRLDALVPAGDRVVAAGGTQDAPVIVSLDDAGHATPVPLTR